MSELLLKDCGTSTTNNIRHNFNPLEPMKCLHFLNKSDKQHNTEEVHESRLVTKLRWVVEFAIGRIKQWKALSNKLLNSQIPYADDYVRFVCLIFNDFRLPLVTSLEADAGIAKMMILAKRLMSCNRSSLKINEIRDS